MSERLLSELTTLRVGGPAEVVDLSTEADIIAAALEVWGSGDDWMVLGGGSNVVVSDDGFEGTVLRTVSRGIEVLPPAVRTSSIPLVAHRETARVDREVSPAESTVRIRVQAGHPWDDLVAETVERGWSGLEALSGIPGSTGASPVQNIGAYGQELAATLHAVDFLDYLTGEVVRLPASQLGLGYRTSTIKQGRQGIVTAVEFTLGAHEGTALSHPLGYAQLAQALGAKLGDRVPIGVLRDAVLELRRSKGMVLSADDPDSVSAGSFFTNPVVSERFARTMPADAPRWPTGERQPDVVAPLGVELPAPAPGERDYRVKLSAAWLIEHAGISRGFRLTGSRAAISSKHSLAIVNTGGASATEILELARYVRALVQVEFGVLLQPEPVLVGSTI
ncbi:UDP-N-acetylmuramate dehydrogenase [Amnibacterium flavum]|uniref:UDP-N-acetylenolpyruvoylglucosamine reductase n=1 Tax=Amnibacterium flavum TaxID=2173173 RepID=A0A2V1HSN1_9MICO|nr:UDP-N-acetylmuramate dehydrogenase [Amnibacterium flavum]PVZ95626.1 UDP-N-acetylmuramate dehydrogenase [Amnibacterium flavum]